MNRRKFLKSTATLGLALASPPLVARAAAKELLVAEPVHGTGYGVSNLETRILNPLTAT